MPNKGDLMTDEQLTELVDGETLLGEVLDGYEQAEMHYFAATVASVDPQEVVTLAASTTWSPR